MKEIKEEALIKYFQVVSDYCNRIVDFINAKYETNINDVPSLIHLKTKNGIDKFMIDDVEVFFHGIGCSVYKNSEQICSWDFSGNGYWCSSINEYKLMLTLNHISGYEEVEITDVRNLCTKLVNVGILEKVFVSTYNVKNNFKGSYCTKIDL